MSDEKKEYLGDGVYAHDDGWHIVLTTEGNVIYLDSGVITGMLNFIERVRSLDIKITAKGEAGK